ALLSERNDHRSPLMTIAKRLVLLLALPLMALLGLGLFNRVQFARIEARSRFVADQQVPSIETIAAIFRNLAEIRVNVRNFLLARSPSDQAQARAAFDLAETEMNRRLREYADRMISDEEDRRMLGEFRDLSREWIAADRRIIALEAEGQR